MILSILFLADAAAKVSFGLCSVPTSMTVTEYNTQLNDNSLYYYHKAVWADKDITDFIKVMSLFVNHAKYWQCEDLYGYQERFTGFIPQT